MELTLAQLASDRKATIRRFENGKSFRNRLASLNIRIGKTIRKVAQQPFRGPVVVEVDHTEVTIGRQMAEKIIVEPLKGE